MSERLDDGFSTQISFAENGAVHFWEKEVTPPGIDGGGPVNTTTMRNVKWRTQWPKKLKKFTQVKLTVAFDPVAVDEFDAMINVNQLITIKWADGDEMDVWGWIDKFTPGPATEGEQQEAEVIIEISMQNDSKVETDPVYRSA